MAEWDFAMLAEELEGLDFEGFDFGFAVLENDSVELAECNRSEIATSKTANCPKCGFEFSI